MRKEFQKIDDLWEEDENNYKSSPSVDETKEHITEDQNIDESLDELDDELDMEKYSKPHNVTLRDFLEKNTTNHSQTQLEAEQLLFKHKITEIISPYYYDNDKQRNIADKIYQTNNLNEIIDLTTQFDSENKIDALNFIKDTHPESAEKIDLILQKAIVEKHIDLWNARYSSKVKEFLINFAKCQRLEELLSLVAKDGKSIKDFNEFGALKDIQKQYPQKTKTIQEILDNLTKAENYDNLGDFYNNMFKLINTDPEHYLKPLHLINKQLSSNKNDRNSLNDLKDLLASNPIEKKPLRYFLEKNPKEKIHFTDTYLKVLKIDLENKDAEVYRVIDHITKIKTDTPEQSDEILDILNKLWSIPRKTEFLDKQDTVLKILKDIAQQYPKKNKDCLSVILKMHKYSKQRRDTLNNAYDISNHLDIISAMTDMAPKTIELALKDLKTIANFYNELEDSDCQDNLDKVLHILNKCVTSDPKLADKALLIMTDIKANEACTELSILSSSLSLIAGHTIAEAYSGNFDKQWKAMQIAENFNYLSTIIEQTEDTDFLKTIIHKKEETYGNVDYQSLRTIEQAFSAKNYIAETLNAKYPELPLEEQLIHAAQDVINSGDEQKKKEFNEFILSEGEPRLSELDSKVMDYLYENCTQDNLNKVNALRSFYGLKVELKAGNTVDVDERAAVRKVFDRTWSSYERVDPKTKKPNPYYENSVTPAYKKYFEEHNIYEIYQTRKNNDEEKKYSMKEYFDTMINQSSFKALRKHGLYNDMKIICDTLETLQVEPELAAQFNLKDLSDMVVNSHNTLEDRKVYSDNGKYMFTRSPHTDELNGRWRAPYYWFQRDDDDEYFDEKNDDKYEDKNTEETDVSENIPPKQYDKEGFEIIPEKDTYSEYNEEPAARDSWWKDLANYNPKAKKHISDAFARHGRTEDAISGFWDAASYGTPGVGSRRDRRYLSSTLHHAEAIQYGGNDDKNNFTGTARYYSDYGDTFDEDDLHIDYHKSFHRRDTPFDPLYICPEVKSATDKLATTENPSENAQKAFLITSFTDPHMHFYAGFRKQDQYTSPLYHMRNIEKEKQERVNKTENQITFLQNLGNALSNIADCVSETLKKEKSEEEKKQQISDKLKELKGKITKTPDKPKKEVKRSNADNVKQQIPNDTIDR